MSSRKIKDPAYFALRALSTEYKNLMEEPVEGFRVKLGPGDDLFNWEVAIFGPPNTVYEGGCFKATMSFPNDYPYSPPTITFISKIWHPNVYENGEICISILHPPIETANNRRGGGSGGGGGGSEDNEYGELACERWNPTQSVRTVLLSVISLLNEPNTSSPANVDASVMYRRWKETFGVDKEYEDIIRKQVLATRKFADAEGIKIPTTLEEYCHKPSGTKVAQPKDDDLREKNDFFLTGYDEDDNDYYVYPDDGDEEEDDDDDEDEDVNIDDVDETTKLESNNHESDITTTTITDNTTTTTTTTTAATANRIDDD